MSIGSVLGSAVKFVGQLIILPFSLAASLLSFLFGTVVSAVISSVLLTVGLVAGLYFAAKYFMSENGAGDVFELPDVSSIRKVVKEKVSGSYYNIDSTLENNKKKVTVKTSDDHVVHQYSDGVAVCKDGQVLKFMSCLPENRVITAANVEDHNQKYDPIPKGAATW